jgi:hypothetical protein
LKDQYVGDVNDYLKYALLRALAPDGSNIAVAWMLTPSDQRSDGQRLRYLTQPHDFRSLDPPLFDALNNLVAGHQRTVRAIEESAILGRAAYVSAVLDDHASARHRYFEQVWDASDGRSLLFFDPDNGLEVSSVRKGRRGSSKYLFWDELATAYGRQHSLILYQHFPRRPRAPFMRQLADRIHDETGCTDVLALTTAHVAFLICPQPPLTASLRARLDDFSSRAAPYATTAMSVKLTSDHTQPMWGQRDLPR